MNQEVQSLLQYAELLDIQIEDLQDVVQAIMKEKSDQVNSSLHNQLEFLLSESGDAEAIRFILKEIVSDE